MFVVAGPPGSGKSTAFPVSKFDCRFFNADDRAAELNGGSYVGISNDIRRVVNGEFEQFVMGSIEARVSFALETTLRSHVTFRQAEMAKVAGFRIEMRYLALLDFAMHLDRVRARADAGGHSASDPTLRRIYDASLANIERAIAEADELSIFDNSGLGGPELVMQAEHGDIVWAQAPLPEWLLRGLGLG